MMNDIEKVIEELNNANKVLIGTGLDVINGLDVVCAIDNAIQTIRELQSKKNIHDFEFDFSNCVSFNCQCGRHYINSGAKWHMVADGDLPKDEQEVLVATEDGVDITTFYTACGCYFDDFNKGDVIAWTELPIFKGEE